MSEKLEWQERENFWEDDVSFDREFVNNVAELHQPVESITDVKAYLEDRMRFLRTHSGKESRSLKECFYTLKMVNQLIEYQASLEVPEE